MSTSFKEKIIRTELAAYVPAKWDGTDRSGIVPLGDNVLVLPDVSSETAGKLGLIQLAQDQQDRQSLGAETGVVVAIGPQAWEWSGDRKYKYVGPKPEVGDRVIFNRYAGRVHVGEDGETYRLMTDNCIGGMYGKGHPNA